MRDALAKRFPEDRAVIERDLPVYEAAFAAALDDGDVGAVTRAMRETDPRTRWFLAWEVC